MIAIEAYSTPRHVLKFLIEKMVHRRDYEFDNPELGDCVQRVSDSDGEDRAWLLEWIRRAQVWQKEPETARRNRLTRISYLESFTLDDASLSDPRNGWEQLGKSRSQVEINQNPYGHRGPVSPYRTYLQTVKRLRL